MHVHLSMVFFLIASTQYTILNKIMFDTSDIQDTLFLEMVATFKFTKKKLIFEMLINAEKVSSTY